MKGFIVTGIHTEVGKSLVAYALAKGLSWPYWKPVQTGTPTDEALARAAGLQVLPAAYTFSLPAAPLIAAQAEQQTIDFAHLSGALAAWHGPLIIEGAGGLFVPLTAQTHLIDLFKVWGLPLILVVRPYLGAMNHTWLSLRALEAYQLPLAGIVLNATRGDPSEAYFRSTFEALLLGEIPYLPSPPPLEVIYEMSGLSQTVPRLLEKFHITS